MSLIIVLDDGCIVEQGTHRQLLAKRGLYDRLYLTQFAGQRLVGTVAETGSMHSLLRHSEVQHGR